MLNPKNKGTLAVSRRIENRARLAMKYHHIKKSHQVAK